METLCLDAPELSIDEIHMPASERDDVVEGEEGEDREEGEEDDIRIELVCRVSSFPSAIVTWSKLTSQQPEIIPAYSQSIGSIDRFVYPVYSQSIGSIDRFVYPVYSQSIGSIDRFVYPVYSQSIDL